MLIIRLARGGIKKRPFYKIVVIERSTKRDGQFVDSLGYFNPFARGQAKRLSLNLEKMKNWTNKGAQLSSRVNSLVREKHREQQQINEKVA